MTYFKTEHRRGLSMLMAVLMVLTMMATSIVAPVSVFADQKPQISPDMSFDVSAIDATTCEMNLFYTELPTAKQVLLSVDEIAKVTQTKPDVSAGDISPEYVALQISSDLTRSGAATVTASDDNTTIVLSPSNSPTVDDLSIGDITFTVEATWSDAVKTGDLSPELSSELSKTDITPLEFKVTVNTYFISVDDISKTHEITGPELTLENTPEQVTDEITVSSATAYKNGQALTAGDLDYKVVVSGDEFSDDAAQKIMVEASDSDVLKVSMSGDIISGDYDVYAYVDEISTDVVGGIYYVKLGTLTINNPYAKDVYDLSTSTISVEATVENATTDLAEKIAFTKNGAPYTLTDDDELTVAISSDELKEYVQISDDGTTLMVITPVEAEVSGEITAELSIDGQVVASGTITLTLTAGPADDEGDGDDESSYTLTVEPSTLSYNTDEMSEDGLEVSTDTVKLQLKDSDGNVITPEDYELTFDVQLPGNETVKIEFSATDDEYTCYTVTVESSAANAIYNVTFSVKTLTVDDETADCDETATLKITIMDNESYVFEKVNDITVAAGTAAGVIKADMYSELVIKQAGTALTVAQIETAVSDDDLTIDIAVAGDAVDEGYVTYDDESRELKLVKKYELTEHDMTACISVTVEGVVSDTGNTVTLTSTLTLTRATTQTPPRPSTGGGETTAPTTPTTPADPTEPSEPSEPAEPAVEEVVEEMAPVASTTENGKATAEVDSKAMDETIAKAVEEAAKKENGAPVVSIPIEVADDAEDLEVKLPASSVDKLAAEKNAALKITSKIGDLKLSNTALKALADAVGENDVITLEIFTSESGVKLSAVQDEKLEEAAAKAGLEEVEVIDVSLLVNDTPKHDFNNGAIEISVRYTLPANTVESSIRVYYMDDNGALTRCTGVSYKDGKVTFTTSHLSMYVISTKALVPEFVDVAEGAYYYDAVLWAYANGITTGYNEEGTTFEPEIGCTRAHFVTFLWRAYGKPAATAQVNFIDIDPSEYYYDALVWAVANGITTGTDEAGTLFSPNDTCTRAQAVTFMHRAAGKPAAAATSSFTDVPAGEYYTDAVSWAIANGITYGNNDAGTTFGPDETCTRGQLVTFLYRQLG